MSSWIPFYGLKGDPFSYEALEKQEDFDQLFVKTNQIESQIDPLVDYVATSRSTCNMVSGPRGAGKTTVLNYIYNRVPRDKVLIARVSLDTGVKAYSDPIQGLGRNLLHGIVVSLLGSIRSNFSHIRDEHEIALKDIGEAVGYDIDLGRYLADKEPSYKLVEVHFTNLCEILEFEKIKGILQIDNLDRLTSLGSAGELLAIEFLRDGPAQQVFSTMTRCGLGVVITIHENWIETIQRDSKFNYMGNLIELAPLNHAQCRDLISKRMESYSTDQPKKLADVFDDSALRRIVQSGRGIPRNVLLLTRACLVRAFENDQKIVTEEIAEEVIQDEQTHNEFHDIIERNPVALKGDEMIDGLSENLEYALFKRNLKGLFDIYKKRKMDLESIQEARYKGLVSVEVADVSREAQFILDQRIRTLFVELDKAGQLRRYIDWFKQPGKISLTQVTPARIKDQEDRIREVFRDLGELVKREDVSNIVNGSYTSYEALMPNIQTEGFDGRRVSRLLISTLKGAEDLAFILEAYTSQKKWPAKINDQDVKRFLISKMPSHVAALGRIVEYCDLVCQGADFDREKLREYVYETNEILLELLGICTKEIQAIKSESTKRLQHTLEIGEIAARIGPWVRSRGPERPESYFLVYREGIPFEEFLIIGWPGIRIGIYALVFGSPSQGDVDGISDYKFKGEVPSDMSFAPYYLKLIIQSRKLQFLFELSPYNERELANCIALYGARGWVTCEFFGKDNNSSILLRKEGDRFDFVHEPYLPSSFGQPLSEPKPVLKLGPEYKMLPSTPHQNLVTIQQIFQNLAGNVIVLDKDFDEDALMLVKNVDSSKVGRLRLLMRRSKVSPRLKMATSAFRVEMQKRGTTVEIRVLDEQDSQEIHDRYVIDKDVAYNVPPLNIIYKKLGDVKRMDNRNFHLEIIEKCWARAQNLDNATVASDQIQIDKKVTREPKRLDVSLAEKVVELRSRQQFLEKGKAIMPKKRLGGLLAGLRRDIHGAQKTVSAEIKDLGSKSANPLGMYSPEQLVEFSQQASKFQGLEQELKQLEEAISKKDVKST